MDIDELWDIDWQVQSLGNPMMDDLEPTGGLSFLANYKPAKFVAVLPGSRAPEVSTLGLGIESS
jgi:hypothetical protein